MAISDFYASTILAVSVDFSLAGFSEAPEAITEKLGISPHEIRRVGDERQLRNGHRIPVTESLWVISSRSTSKDVNVHLRELLSVLIGKEKIIRPRWHPAFGVLWKGNYLYAGSGPFYEADVIAGIARLGAGLWQDIYQVDEGEGGAT